MVRLRGPYPLRRLDRQPGGAPGLETAVEVRRIGQPELVQRRGREARLVALVAHDDQSPAAAVDRGIAVGAAGIAAPLEHVAWHERGAGDDPVGGALALGAD